MPNQLPIQVIVVPGLDDGRYNFMPLLAKLWNREDVVIRVCRVGWRDHGTYEHKLQKLLNLIDELTGQGFQVALIGISAGGSLTINAFVERPDDVVGVISVCGRLRPGQNVKPTLEEAGTTSRAFIRSVEVCGKMQHRLTRQQRRRVLTMRPWRDQVVPMSTMLLQHSPYRRVFGFSHVQSIVTCMVFYRKPILRFLREAS